MRSARGERGLCFREVQTSIKDSSFELVGNSIDRLKIAGYRAVENEYRHKSGGKIVFKGLKGGSKDQEKTRIKSFENFKWGWNEEAMGTTKEHLDLIMPTFRLDESQVVFTYNRYSDADPVHKMFVMSDRSDTEVLNVNYDDVRGFLSESMLIEADNMRDNDYDSWLHIYGGEPMYQLEDAIISRNDVNNAVERDVNTNGEEQIGADIARKGSDKTIFYKRKGMKVVDSKRITDKKKKKVPMMARALMGFANMNKNIPIKVDDTGVGGGVTDILEEENYMVIPVNNGQKAKDKNKYRNAINEMWFEFADDINNVSIPNNEELKEELKSRLFKFDSSGRREVEKKEDFKKRIGRSPDDSDALLLCFYNVQKGSIITTSKVLGW